MRGMPEFRRHPGMRELPQPGRPDDCRGFASVPWLHEGRSRRGVGPRGTTDRDGSGWGLTFVPCFRAVRTLWGWVIPVRAFDAPRPAARCFPAPHKGASCGVQPRGPWALSSAPCRRSAGKGLGAPFRGAGKAAASSRCALPSRRASVVSTVSVSERVETTHESSQRRNLKPLNEGGLWTSDSQKMPFWARNARKRVLQNG